MSTKFVDVYDCFLSKITDDQYLELTPQDTMKSMQQLLLDAIPKFEFPRVVLSEYEIDLSEKSEDDIKRSDYVVAKTTSTFDPITGVETELDEPVYTVDNSSFDVDLTSEEINILATLMLQGWLQRQITSIEVTRMKYTGSDFKMTSQANHLAKLLTLNEEVVRQCTHLQRLYHRRRINDDGTISSNWDILNHHKE